MRNPLTRLLNRHGSINVLRLEGVIGAAARFGGPTLSDVALAPMVQAAFTRGKPQAVAVVVNSPGGSPVQSSLIASRIRRLADEKHVPVHAFVEDVAASGGYWLAIAADDIHVDASSIVGSIGVISASFGFHELLERHGVERRVYTAGEDKSLLDPFRPERPEDVARLRRLQKIIHDNFIAQVTARRGARLGGDNLFSGDIWVGQGGVEAGLADGIGHLVPVMRARYGDRIRFNVIRARRPLIRRLGVPGVQQAVGEAAGAIEARAVWARYGVQAP
jgi:signal peptide peptidase SppA